MLWRVPRYTLRDLSEKIERIMHVQLRGHHEVLLPRKMINIFSTVKAYENYVRRLRSRLFAKILKTTRQESVASYETDKLLHSLGLPKLDT